MTAFAALRRNMVDCQLRTFDIHDRAVLAAMGEVPRERFVPPGQEALAYLDRNVPVPGGAEDPRVVLAPMILGRLIQALAVETGLRVLDVAAGYGYGAAILAALGAEVVSVDAREDLAAAWDANPARAAGVTRVTGPLGEAGAPHGPYGAILVNGAVAERPERLLDLLSDGGRLACLTGDGRTGKATLYVRSGDAIGYRTLFDGSAPLLAAFRPAPAFSF